MSYNTKISGGSDKYITKNIQIPSKSKSPSGLSVVQLKELIQNEVYEILGGIKQQIEKKMKQVDRNIILLKNQFIEIKKNISSKSNSPSQHKSFQIQESLKELFTKMNKIQKEISNIKNAQNINDYSYHNSGDVSKSNISTYKLNQSGDKSGNSKQKNNSPIFKKIINSNIDLGSLLFDQEKSNKKENQDYLSHLQQSPLTKNDKKQGIFTNIPQNLRKPPLPSVDKPKFSTSYEVSTSSSFYDQNKGNELRANKIMNQNEVYPQTVQKQLSKNKSVFLRKKKSEQKLQTVEQQRSYGNKLQQHKQKQVQGYRFENQLQQFDDKQQESFNIQLQYSKDTFLQDI